MTKERDTKGIFDATGGSPKDTLVGGHSVSSADAETNVDAATSGDAGTDDDKPAFDPFKFQHLTVSPTLRQELSAAKLARLDPEYFEDTVPPNRLMASPEAHAAPGSENVELESAAPTSTRRNNKGLVIGVLVAAGTLIVIALAMGTKAPSVSEKEHDVQHPAIAEPAAHTAPALQVSAPPVVATPSVEREPLPAPEPTAGARPQRADRPEKTHERGKRVPNTEPETRRVPSAAPVVPAASHSAGSFLRDPQ